jgi:hypothetical protein
LSAGPGDAPSLLVPCADGRRRATIRLVNVKTVFATVVALSVVGLAGPAQAGRPVVDQDDRAGDVKVFDEGGTDPSLTQNRSIDIRNFKVRPRGEGVRFELTIAKVLNSAKYLQILEVQFEAADPGQVWFLDALAVPQSPASGTAYYSPTLDADQAVSCQLRVSTKGRTVRIDVPADCVPREPGIMRAFAYLNDSRDPVPGFSEDSLRVSGRVDLG